MMKAARALADWALTNPEDAARVAAMLATNPGGGRDVYLPLLKSTSATPSGLTRGQRSQES
jgi:hypothetical protein